MSVNHENAGDDERQRGEYYAQAQSQSARQQNDKDQQAHARQSDESERSARSFLKQGNQNQHLPQNRQQHKRVFEVVRVF